MSDGFLVIFCRTKALKLLICLGDSSRRVEACGVTGRHSGVSVVVGRRSSMGIAIKRLEVRD